MRSKRVLAASIAACLGVNHALAQQLEEIVVTATRRVESLQDVPISVTALTGEAVLQGGFSDLEDLSVFVPNLYMRDAFSGQQLYIRGIGTSEGNESYEQAVAQFVDGVYYGRDDLGQNGVFDMERLEVVRGPQPIFAGQSATAGALNVISRRPGDEFEGNVTLGYGATDEETTLEFGFGGPITENFGLRFAGREYELKDPGWVNYVNGEPVGNLDNASYRLLGVWEPTDRLSFEFKYEYQDVLQNGTPRNVSRCDLDPTTSSANLGLTRGFAAMCAYEHLLDSIALPLSRDDLGRTGERGLLDIWEVAEALDAQLGLTPGDRTLLATYPSPTAVNPTVFGPSFTPVECAVNPVQGCSPVRRGLNNVRQFNQPTHRTHQADVFMFSVDWAIGDLTLSTITSNLQYDKFHVLDPDASSIAAFSAERLEYFDQTAQEIRLSSQTDQTFSWMVGLYYQQHDLDSNIPIYAAAGAGFQGQVLEDSEWNSVFFASTYNISETLRLNIGARYQDVRKEGQFVTWRAFLPPGPQGPGAEFPPWIRGTTTPLLEDSSDTLPEVGLQWDVSDDVMLYAKYSEAFKAGGFVISPAPGGNLPPRLTFKPETADGIELGLKSFLADGRVQFNFALYDTDYQDLQVTVFDDTTSVFITTNAAKANTQGIEWDGRWAATDNFTLGFSGTFGEAEYTNYPGADQCNSKYAKEWALANPGVPCTRDLSGTELPHTPEWTLVFTPQWTFNMGANLVGNVSGSVLVSDGYDVGGELDPLSRIDDFHRVDLRFGIQPADGNWEVAVYGRDITDEKTFIGAGAVDFQSRTLLVDYDAGGGTPSRGARYGVQLRYFF
ncbi:MAG: TonB-dependent receptor [Gammaproteobacteria bacterium]